MSRNRISAIFRTVILLVIVSAGQVLTPVAPTSAASLPNLLVYPYIGMTTSSSVVISWATNTIETGKVSYSQNQSYGSVAAASSFARDGKAWYSASLTNLKANTTYYYKIFQSGNDITPWPTITFTTAPEAAIANFSFTVLGDSQTVNAGAPPNQQAIDLATQMDQFNPDLVVRTGDMIYDGGICTGNDSAWNQYMRNYFTIYRQILGDTPVYTTVGNHEIQTGGCGYESYTDVFHLPENAPTGDKEKYYSFDWANAHFVSLDTQQRYKPDSPQYKWLLNDLKTNTQPWKFVFLHQPVYSSGNHGNTPNLQTYLKPLFEAYGVDAVFSGHDHDYERTCPIRNGACTTAQDGGVVYYVTGGGGAWTADVGSSWFTAYSDKVDEFVKVDVSACRLQLDTIGKTGQVIDSYAIDRCGTFTFPSEGSQDGWVLESDENSSKGGTFNVAGKTFSIGDNLMNRQYKAILSFDTSSLPDDAVITSVDLRIKQSGKPTGSNPFSILGNLLADIRNGPFGGAYTLAANDFQALATARKVATFDKTPTGGWYSASLNLTGRNKINKGSITQFRLYFAKGDNDDMGADYLRFYSGNSAAANKPQLIITYTMP